MHKVTILVHERRPHFGNVIWASVVTKDCNWSAQEGIKGLSVILTLLC